MTSALPIASEPGRGRQKGQPWPAPAAGTRRQSGNGRGKRATARKVCVERKLAHKGCLPAFPDTLSWGNFLIVKLEKSNIPVPLPNRPPQELHVPNQPRQANPAAVSAAEPRSRGRLLQPPRRSCP
jgi:hypothetical protein